MLGSAVAALLVTMIASGRPRLAAALTLVTAILLPWRGGRFPSDARARRRAWAGLVLMSAGAFALFVWGLSARVTLLAAGVVLTVVGAFTLYGRPPIFGGPPSGS